MTVTRLSASAAKVQLTAEELHGFLPETPQASDSPQMLRLLSFMLLHAEAGSGIRFSALPVTVELLRGSDGSLTAFFTAQLPASAKPGTKAVRLAAAFTDRDTLIYCCKQLASVYDRIPSAALYEYGRHYVLTLKLKRKASAHAHHILREYGAPFRCSGINKARLAEFGTCIHAENAVQEILRKAQRSP